jgi:O-antigen/teichoic acid export membrane protein
MGLGSTVISLLPQQRHQPAEFLRVVFSTAAVAACVVAGLFLVVALLAFHELSVVASSPVWAVAFVGMGLLWTMWLLLEQTSMALRRGQQALMRSVVFGLLRLGSIPLLFLVRGSLDALTIFLAWIPAGIAVVVLGHSQLRRSVPGFAYRPASNPPLVRRALSVSLPNHALNLSLVLPGLLLPIVVPEALSATDNAYWYIAWMLAAQVFIVPAAIGTALFAEASNQPHALHAGVRQSIRLALLLGSLAAIGAIVMAGWILPLLGETYSENAMPPLRILVWAVVPLVFVEIYVTTCRMLRRVTEATVATAAVGLLGVAAAALVGHAHGLWGVATAWLAAVCVSGGWAAWRLWCLRARTQELPC